MSKEQETEVTDSSFLPRSVFHVVSKELFDKFIDKDGNYDCRYKKEWGENSPFIHTTPAKKQLKERVADINWLKFSIEEEFLLLKIDFKKIESKITYSTINGYVYHHIWGILPKGSFQTSKVGRSKDGRFLFK